MHYNHPHSHSPTGFGSNNYRERFDEQEMRLSNYRIWKKLYMPKHTLKDPENPYRIVYSHHTEEDLMREVFFLLILIPCLIEPKCVI